MNLPSIEFCPLCNSRLHFSFIRNPDCYCTCHKYYILLCGDGINIKDALIDHIVFFIKKELAIVFDFKNQTFYIDNFYLFPKIYPMPHMDWSSSTKILDKLNLLLCFS